ncbi:MAG TPA: MBL fold metallo-hydrolase [Candidatus Paceibacterota bacterium]|nr:MBL fold metallo-hydrolase [Candidatus Paceibacterota bacterium]
MEILPGIHRIECPIGTRYIAVYAIVGSAATLIVDTGFDGSMREVVVPYFNANGLSLDAVLYAVNTHSDFDHTGGNRAVKELMPNALICCGERDRPMIENLQSMIDDRYGEFADDHNFDETSETKAFIRTVAFQTRVDIGFSGNERIDLGDRVIEILHTPGHSWGHLSFWDEKTGVVIIGDAVLGASVLHADGQPAFPPTYRFVEAYRSTIRLLKGYKPTEVLTSHYPRYQGQSAIDFLDTSLAYTDLVERTCMETLQMAFRPLTLMELIDQCHERLGPWGDPEYKYLVYPVLGHLEVLESYQRIARSRNASGLMTWSVD